MTESCYYQTSTYDPETSLPLYVLDTTFIPYSIFENSDSNTSIKFINDEIIDKLPRKDHTLVIFTNGFYQQESVSVSTTKISLNLIRLLKLIPVESKKYLKKIYIVHNNWIFKSIVDIISKIYSFNTSNSTPIILNCENLSSLSKFIDITKIPISLHTYIVDKLQFKSNRIILNRHLPQLYARPLTIYTFSTLPLNQFQRIYNNLIAYLSNKQLDIQLSQSDWQTIIKCTTLSKETKLSIDILSDCLKRDQVIKLSDYSFLEHYMIIVKFILKLSNSNCPLIPIELLISYHVNFNNLDQVNVFLNKILTYRHPLIDTENKNTRHTIDSYDNSYILIKIFKLFKYLLLKLQRETEILEPNAKNLQKSKDRQSLRLILSFTKILYTDNSSEDSLSSTDDDDIGFDNLFKLIKSIMENFDYFKIFNTVHKIDDFNNFINFDDFLAFENFKNDKLGINDVINSIIIHEKESSTTASPIKPSIANNTESPTSPTKSKPVTLASSASIAATPTDLPLDTPPLPPLARKNKLLYMNDGNTSSNSILSSTSQSSTSSLNLGNNPDSSMPLVNLDMNILNKEVDSISLTDNISFDVSTESINSDDMFKTPKRNKKDAKENPEHNDDVVDLVNELLTPMQLTNSQHPQIFDLLTPKQKTDQTPTPCQFNTPIKTPSSTTTTTAKSNPISTANKLSHKQSTNSLLQSTIQLRKYTEKDLAVQQRVEREKQAALNLEKHQKEIELGVRRGERKVSRLARLYEEKFDI